jgi:hypothetical protein
LLFGSLVSAEYAFLGACILIAVVRSISRGGSSL